jgi:hypothetical protein
MERRNELPSGDAYEYVVTNWWSDEEMTLTRRLKTQPVASTLEASVQPVHTGRLTGLMHSMRVAFAKVLTGHPGHANASVSPKI